MGFGAALFGSCCGFVAKTDVFREETGRIPQQGCKEMVLIGKFLIRKFGTNQEYDFFTYYSKKYDIICRYINYYFNFIV
ncbi:hypothetical protein CO230_09335 [Chryseobacterium sp. 6424]|nr:hypothetical protein CO230_09335 [Chryseobacterium sp. 6424]